MTMGRAISKVMAPVTASAWRMPTAALALWMTLVSSRPTRIPSSGLEKEVSASINTWLSRRGETASLIMDMPYISTAKPRRMSPHMMGGRPLGSHAQNDADDGHQTQTGWRCSKGHPAAAAAETQEAEDSPGDVGAQNGAMTMPMAWFTFIMPEFTNPTTITEVAEDWIHGSDPVPKQHLQRRAGQLIQHQLQLASGDFFRPSPMMAMPNKNSAIPPRRLMISDAPEYAAPPVY